MYKIVFATNNAHKLREIREILAGKAEVMSLNDIGCHADIPETADTLEGNALIKAHYVYDRYHIDCFADDTGLEVDALGGAPGVRTARYAGDDHDTTANMRKLLREMEGKSNRRARFRTAIALIQHGQEHLFSGEVEGEIATEPRGNQGFGYDPVFVPWIDKDSGYSQYSADSEYSGYSGYSEGGGDKGAGKDDKGQLECSANSEYSGYSEGGGDKGQSEYSEYSECSETPDKPYDKGQSEYSEYSEYSETLDRPYNNSQSETTEKKIAPPARNTLTFAQMGEEAKNRISHRARAVHKLLAFLQSQVPNS